MEVALLMTRLKGTRPNPDAPVRDLNAGTWNDRHRSPCALLTRPSLDQLGNATTAPTIDHRRAVTRNHHFVNLNNRSPNLPGQNAEPNTPTSLTICPRLPATEVYVPLQ